MYSAQEYKNLQEDLCGTCKVREDFVDNDENCWFTNIEKRKEEIILTFFYLDNQL